MSYKTEILRLEPQNDIATQPLDRGIQKKPGLGACPVLDTGVKPDNDNIRIRCGFTYELIGN